MIYGKRGKRKKYGKKFLKKFWGKVDIGGIYNCWNWKKSVQSKGYGSVCIGNGKTALAHRVAYEIAHGFEIPEGKMVLHKCDNRKCVNPRHLFLGTNTDNVKDMVKKGRQAKGEKNGRSKLTYGEIENIRKINKEKKYIHREIADQFGVSISSIRKILSEEYWKLPLAE